MESEEQLFLALSQLDVKVQQQKVSGWEHCMISCYYTIILIIEI